METITLHHTLITHYRTQLISTYYHIVNLHLLKLHNKGVCVWGGGYYAVSHSHAVADGFHLQALRYLVNAFTSTDLVYLSLPIYSPY